MKPVSIIAGIAIPLGRDNVDTDAILPGRYLKTITRTGLGKVAFEGIRIEQGNLFDDPQFAGAPILIAGSNFGCGSSREHAVWAMLDYGIQAVIAERFGDIFSGNAFKNGLLAVTQSRAAIDRLLADSAGGLSIDLARQSIRTRAGSSFRFEIDPFRKQCLLEGLDEIDLTLQDAARIDAFERLRVSAEPWLDVIE